MSEILMNSGMYCPDCSVPLRTGSIEYSSALLVCPSCGSKKYARLKEN